MALATPTVYAYLASTLVADATLMAMGSPPLSTGLRVYRNEAPQGAATPFIIVQQLSMLPTKVIGNVTIWGEAVFLVKGVDRNNSPVVIEPIMQRVDTVLDSASGTVTAGTVYFVSSEDEVFYTEHEPGGPAYQHVGRRWRVLATAA